MNDDEADVPYGEDFHDVTAATAWADAAIRKRPWRATIFEHFVTLIDSAPMSSPRVLELGSGPGFLAEQVLAHCSGVQDYTLVDFSAPMLEQSRKRLVTYSARTHFVQADFKTDAWPSLVNNRVDFVLSLQAVHELRHKRHASRLYARVRPLLSEQGELLICDHLPAIGHAARHKLLYMSQEESIAAFNQAGFADVTVVWSEHDMALYRARVERSSRSAS